MPSSKPNMATMKFSLLQPACFLVLFLSSAVLCQENEEAQCPRICRRTEARAQADCSAIQEFVASCSVQTCTRATFIGFRCSKRPSPSPTPSPKVLPVKTPEGKSAQCSGDPHLSTFDNLPFDCQARGEFFLARALSNPAFEIQGRFSETGQHYSLTTGVVVAHEGMPRLQFSIPTRDKTRSAVFEVGGRRCKVAFFRNRRNQKLRSQNFKKYAITVSNREIRVRTPSGITLLVRVAFSNSFGCFFTLLQTFIPGEVLLTADVTGLLGTPNGNRNDDWRARDGAVIPFRSISQYQYCSNNWCIEDAKESLFTYETKTSHATFKKCGRDGDAEGPMPNLAAAPQALRDICGANQDCLFDGIIGGEEDAIEVLRSEQVASIEIEQTSNFKFEPPTIRNGAPVTLEVSLDVSAEVQERRNGLEKFVVYQIDGDTGAKNGLVFDLLDNGLAANSDEKAGDAIYSNHQSVRINTLGDALSFEAVPVFLGIEDPDSELALTKINGVKSFSPASGLGMQDPTEIRNSKVPTLDDLEMKVTYSWKSSQLDLDTATEFLGDIGGYGCFGAEKFVKFLEDDTTTGGAEAAIVLLGETRKAGLWKRSTTITFKAGWHLEANDSPDSPVSLTTVLQDSRTKAEIPNSKITIAISPGQQFDCAEKVVATMKVDVGFRVTMTLTSD